MEPSIYKKLESLVDRHLLLAKLLTDSEVLNDQNRCRELSKEYSQLEPVVEKFQQYQRAIESCESAKILMHDEDPSMHELAKEELHVAEQQIADAEKELKVLLLPKDPDDDKNIFLEIRAGTGGDEAAIFVGDLFRMYSYYAEQKGWRVEIIHESVGEHGGYKEIIVRLTGKNVYSQLKFESGAHRVQRVPETETQGRIHTSACTVAVLPEATAIDHIDINPSDLRIDTFRASGAGGQHVNRTDSAVRITHIPTGVVVECQDERSQHKNKARAMSVLQAKILAAERKKQQDHIAQTRRNLVGSGDRSERIRTYNYPQGRVTDHRINLTLYKLSYVMEGQLDQIIQPLIQEHQTDLLSAQN